MQPADAIALGNRLFCLTTAEVYRTLAYRNPSAKAPVIHPGDEAPFLVWRGGRGAQR